MVSADAWAQVTVAATVGPRATGQWSVKLARAGQPEVAVTDLLFASDAFKAMEWLGFCSTAKGSTAYYLDDFFVGEKK